jgi:hypothetical protein
VPRGGRERMADAVYFSFGFGDAVALQGGSDNVLFIWHLNPTLFYFFLVCVFCLLTVPDRCWCCWRCCSSRRGARRCPGTFRRCNVTLLSHLRPGSCRQRAQELSPCCYLSIPGPEPVPEFASAFPTRFLPQLTAQTGAELDARLRARAISSSRAILSRPRGQPLRAAAAGFLQLPSWPVRFSIVLFSKLICFFCAFRQPRVSCERGAERVLPRVRRWQGASWWQMYFGHAGSVWRSDCDSANGWRKRGSVCSAVSDAAGYGVCLFSLDFVSETKRRTF